MNTLTFIAWLLLSGAVIGLFQFNINEAPPKETKPIVMMQSQPGPKADTAPSPLVTVQSQPNPAADTAPSQKEEPPRPAELP